MSKEKLIRLTKYQSDVKSRLSESTPSKKQSNRPKEYKQFLERELSTVTNKIEALKVSLPTGDKKLKPLKSMNLS